MKRQYSDHFTEAGEAAARGEQPVYRKPQPAHENDDLTAALIRMRTLAAHNYPSKGTAENGNKETSQ